MPDEGRVGCCRVARAHTRTSTPHREATAQAATRQYTWTGGGRSRIWTQRRRPSLQWGQGRRRFCDPRAKRRGLQRPLDRRARQRRLRIPPGKEPGPRPVVQPVGAQRVQERPRQNHLAIPISLAVTDRDHHPIAVDVAHLESQRFRESEPRAVQCHRHGPVLPVPQRLQQPHHLLAAEHHGLSRLLPWIG